jgi:hypothetical protein
VAVPADEPVVTAFDQGLGRGDGVFESVAVIGADTPHLGPHLERMAGSAALLDLADPGPQVWRALVAAALADWPAHVEGVCRLFLTRGLGEGFPPTALALLAPVPAEVVRQRTEGISVVSLGLGVPADFRSEAPWLLGGAKTLSYAVNMAALRHAHAVGADDVVLTSLGGAPPRGPDVDRRLGGGRQAAHAAAGHRDPARHHRGPAVRAGRGRRLADRLDRRHRRRPARRRRGVAAVGGPAGRGRAHDRRRRRGDAG